MKTYDAIVIGAGQAGPFLAASLSNQGQTIALIEGNKIGGSCVNYGCTPTKTMIASARAIHMARQGDLYGFSTGPIEVDINRIIDRVTNRVQQAQSGMDGWMRGDDNIDVYDAYGSFEGTENGWHRVRAGDDVIASKRVFINTGTSPFVPPIEGIDSVSYFTNRNIIELREIPEHLIILGGGYIGMEMAQTWRRFGAEVTIVEAVPRLLSREDEDTASEIQRILDNENINVLVGHLAVKVQQDGGDIRVTLKETGGNHTEISGSHLLVSVGRKPNSPGLNLQSVGVEVDDRGYIVTDEHLRTSIDGIWALGDVNGRGAFTHTSYQEYEIVLDNLNGGTRKVDRPITYAMFLDPPLGRVGMNETQARESGRNVLMTIKPLSHIGRAIEQGETFGHIKILVDADTEQFLGATVLGYQGDDVVQIIAYYMATGATYHPMKEALPLHPTIAEFFPTLLGELKPLD